MGSVDSGEAQIVLSGNSVKLTIIVRSILAPRAWGWHKGLATKGQCEGTFEMMELSYILIVKVGT